MTVRDDPPWNAPEAVFAGARVSQGIEGESCGVHKRVGQSSLAPSIKEGENASFRTG